MSYVPLHELPTGLSEELGFAWQVEPNPNIDQERVMVNVGRSLLVARIAGFGPVTVGQYSGEQASPAASGFSVTGLNTDGSMTGVATGTVARAKRERVNIEDDVSWMPSNHRWPAATIEVNRNETASRAADRVSRGQGRDAAWAAEYDSAVRQGFIKLAGKKFKQDITNYGEMEPLKTAVYTSFATYDIVTDHPVFLAFFFGIVQASSLFGSAVQHKKHIGDTCIDQKRWSILPNGFQPDRTLGSMLLAGSSNFVTYRT